LRKAAHSRIEKLRRNKINDALATLKQLVPPNFKPPSDSSPDDDGDPDDRDPDYAAKPRPPGKKEEKEKEFKLEILVRTVSYMQYLIDRVAVLEAGQSDIQSSSQSPKRKRDLSVGRSDWPAKRPLTAADAASPSLPPISAWLPSNIDPSLCPPPPSPLTIPIRGKTQSPNLYPLVASHQTTHLPSPPSSTHFSPMLPIHAPPSLTLNPAAAPLRSSPRTPEEETAASLLLQISASSSSLPSAAVDMKSPLDQCTEQFVQRVPQTPSSILGLRKRM
jgi:hypothetical protein